MGEGAAALLAFATREITLFAAIGLLIGGIDDLLIDLLWIGRAGWRRLTVYSRHPRMTAQTLPPPEEPGRIAIFIAAWQEHAVIGHTLRRALETLRHDDFRIYIGTYPNDPATADAVWAIGDPRVRLVGGALAGPTTKAECLNRVWRAMLFDEIEEKRAFKAIVLHDAEDRMHADELRLFDRLIERFDFIQIPVLPLVRRGSPFVSGHYVEEFLEAHARQMVVREALGAAVPSSGVGSAISRRALGRIAREAGGEPFDPTTLTEDYEIGLRLKKLGMRGAFVWMPERPGGRPVAVKAEFPHLYRNAVKQKTRWTIGIALAGWDRLHWSGGLAESWMRLRDRRTILAAVVIAASYAAFVLYWLSWFTGVQTDWAPWVWPVLIVNTISFAWRAVMRFGMVTHYYGLAQGLLTIPRLFVANAIAINAAWRAMRTYLPGATPPWEKTTHFLPDPVECD